MYVEKTKKMLLVFFCGLFFILSTSGCEVGDYMTQFRNSLTAEQSLQNFQEYKLIIDEIADKNKITLLLDEKSDSPVYLKYTGKVDDNDLYISIKNKAINFSDSETFYISLRLDSDNCNDLKSKFKIGVLSDFLNVLSGKKISDDTITDFLDRCQKEIDSKLYNSTGYSNTLTLNFYDEWRIHYQMDVKDNHYSHSIYFYGLTKYGTKDKI